MLVYEYVPNASLKDALLGTLTLYPYIDLVIIFIQNI